MSYSGMKQFRRSLKVACFVALAALLLVLLLGAAAQIQQQRLYPSAGQPLADMRDLDMRKTTFEEVQPIFRRWGNRATYLGECDANRCDFILRLKDFAYAHEQFLSARFEAVTLVSLL